VGICDAELTLMVSEGNRKAATAIKAESNHETSLVLGKEHEIGFFIHRFKDLPWKWVL
jgi:hypothetical protein